MLKALAGKMSCCLMPWVGTLWNLTTSRRSTKFIHQGFIQIWKCIYLFMLVSLLIVKQTSPSNKREHSFRPVAKHAIMLYAISRLNVTHLWPISWALKLTCYREYNSTSLGGGIKVTLASTEWWCYSARDGDMKLGETQWSACPQSGCPIHAL